MLPPLVQIPEAQDPGILPHPVPEQPPPALIPYPQLEESVNVNLPPEAPKHLPQRRASLPAYVREPVIGSNQQRQPVANYLNADMNLPGLSNHKKIIRTITKK